MSSQKKNRLVFVNRFFYPDISATSQLLSELAFELADKGYKVTVITSASAYHDSKIKYEKQQLIHGVEVVRVAAGYFQRTNYLGRFLDLIRFYLAVSLILFKSITDADILICKTDPPMLVVMAAFLKSFKKCRLVVWNQDLFPEIIQSKLKSWPLSWLYTLLLGLRNRAFKSADHLIAISETMKTKLNQLGNTSVSVIENWSANHQINQDEINKLALSWNLENKFIVQYSGNFGFVHDYETIVQVIASMKNHTAIKFVFVGSGTGYQRLQQFVKSNQLTNVLFKPYQPKDDLARSLGIADIHLITFDPQMEELVFPSKFYGICAAARPILFIGNTQGELASLIKQHDCGESFDIGSVKSIADYLVQISVNKTHLSKQGDNAHYLYNGRYTRQHSVSRWQAVLQRL